MAGVARGRRRHHRNHGLVSGTDHCSEDDLNALDTLSILG